VLIELRLYKIAHFRRGGRASRQDQAGQEQEALSAPAEKSEVEEPRHYVSARADWRVRSSDETPARAAVGITRRRDLTHYRYRHSNRTALTPADGARPHRGPAPRSAIPYREPAEQRVAGQNLGFGRKTSKIRRQIPDIGCLRTGSTISESPFVEMRRSDSAGVIASGVAGCYQRRHDRWRCDSPAVGSGRLEAGR
jgi:hypothetical protein